MVKCMQITITGDIQDKGFRFSVVHIAYSLSLKGFVEYSLGGVLIEAEGEADHLDQFVDWCRNGPFSAWVDNIDVNVSEFKNHHTFEIRHGNEKARKKKISQWSSVKTLCELCVKKITQS